MRWGVLGTGRIARAFMAAVASSPEAEGLAVASRDRSRAEAAARDFAIGRAYGSYQELLSDLDVDAVYVSLPNSLHAPWSIRAAEAGKHVLCEKPLAIDVAQAETMLEAARRRDVWLMEAFMYRFHPRTLKLQELIRDGVIGPVRLIRASFGFTVTDPANVRLDPSLAGGALMDVGCYCVNFARMIVGTRPTRVTAVTRMAPTGVDETLAGTLEFESGAIAQVSCSFASSHHNVAQVIGAEGIVQIDDAFTPPADRPSRLELLRGARYAAREELRFPPADQYRLEAEGFGRLVAAGPDGSGLPQMPPSETLDNMATIEGLRRSSLRGGAEEPGAG